MQWCASVIEDLTADLRLNTTSFSGSFFWLITYVWQHLTIVGRTSANPYRSKSRVKMCRKKL